MGHLSTSVISPSVRPCALWCTGEAHDDIPQLCVGADIAVPTAGDGDVKVGLSDEHGHGPRIELLAPGMLTLTPGEAEALIAALQAQVNKTRGRAPQAAPAPARTCEPWCTSHDEEGFCFGEDLTVPGGKYNEPSTIGISYTPGEGTVINVDDRYMLLQESKAYTLALLRQIEKAQKSAPLAVCA